MLTLSFLLLHSRSSLFFRFYTTDVNECLSPHACQLNERCVNTAGSYICQRQIACPPGYQINNDICEGTPHVISIKVLTSTHSECPLKPSRRALVWLRVYNAKQAHCSGKQSLLQPIRERALKNPVIVQFHMWPHSQEVIAPERYLHSTRSLLMLSIDGCGLSSLWVPNFETQQWASQCASLFPCTINWATAEVSLIK